MTKREVYEDTMNTMLRLKYMIGISDYLQDKTLTNYRDFEEEIETKGYPIHAPTMKSSIKLITDWVADKRYNRFFEPERIISSWDTTEEMAGGIIPYEKMFFLHLFTLFEGYGNRIIEIVNYELFTKIDGVGAWHGSVNKHNKSLNESIEKFKSIFKIQSAVCPNEYVGLLLEIKEKRNKIAHENEYNKGKFYDDVDAILLLTSYIYFMVSNDNSEIEIFPWEKNADWMFR